MTMPVGADASELTPAFRRSADPRFDDVRRGLAFIRSPRSVSRRLAALPSLYGTLLELWYDGKVPPFQVYGSHGDDFLGKCGLSDKVVLGSSLAQLHRLFLRLGLAW